jgi:hypothetical protein
VTPTPIPAFAPVLKLHEEQLEFVVGREDTDDDDVNDDDETISVGVIEELEPARLEVAVVDDDAAFLRTRNPGLDRSAVLGSNVELAALNRKTYFASTVKLEVGITMVQA